MLTYIDGYNVLFRFSSGEGRFQTTREEFIDELVESARAVSYDIIVVFDAPNQIGEHSRTHKGGLEIVYTTTHQCADTYILDEVARLISREQILVVTSDKKLARKAGNLGAKTQSVETFFTWLASKQQKKKKKKRALPKEESVQPKEHRPYDSEFERWLTLFEKRLCDPDLPK